MSNNAFLTYSVSQIRTDDIMEMASKRDFEPRKLVFPSSVLAKNAQSMTSWISKVKLRPLGLNLTTRKCAEGRALLLTLEEFNNG